MGSMIADSASVSKAALASAASVFKRRPNPKPGQPTSPSQHDASSKAPTVPCSDFDRQYMGPAKYAEVQQMLKKGWSGYVPPPNTDRTLDINEDVFASTMCALGGNRDSISSNPAPAQESNADSAVPVPAFPCDPGTVNACARMVTTSDGQIVPVHEVARSMLDSAFIQRGLASPDSAEYQQSLPQLLGMVPESLEVRLARQSQTAQEPQPNLNLEPSTAGTAGVSITQEAVAVANSNSQHSTAGAAGSQNHEAGNHSKAEHGTVGSNEPGEQWSGSQPPGQIAASALAAAAENAAVAQQPEVSSLQRVEETFETVDAETPGNSLGAG